MFNVFNKHLAIEWKIYFNVKKHALNETNWIHWGNKCLFNILLIKILKKILMFFWFTKYGQFFIKIIKWIINKQILNKIICEHTIIIKN